VLDGRVVSAISKTTALLLLRLRLGVLPARLFAGLAPDPARCRHENSKVRRYLVDVAEMKVVLAHAI